MNPGGESLLKMASVKPYRSYIIATAPRTGSSLLSEALATTGRAGRPDEFFDANPQNEAHWAKLYGAPEGGGYLDGIVAASSSTNGVFGCKLHWHQLPALRARLARAMPVRDGAGGPDERPILELLAQRLPDTRFVWLSRRNKVAQAISYYRAAQSGIWRTFKDNRHGDAGPTQIPDFDRAAIAHYVRTVEQMDAGWRQFFNHHKIPAVVVVYEDLIKFYTPTVRGVLKYLDLPYTDVLLPEPNIQRLSDAESDEWERRFRAVRAAAPSA